MEFFNGLGNTIVLALHDIVTNQLLKTVETNFHSIHDIPTYLQTVEKTLKYNEDYYFKVKRTFKSLLPKTETITPIFKTMNFNIRSMGNDLKLLLETIEEIPVLERKNYSIVNTSPEVNTQDYFNECYYTCNLLGFNEFSNINEQSIPIPMFEYLPRKRIVATRLLTVEDETQLKDIDDLYKDIDLMSDELSQEIQTQKEELKEAVSIFLKSLVAMTINELKGFIDEQSLETVRRIKMFTNQQLTNLMNYAVSELALKADLKTVNVIDEFFKVINSAMQFGDFNYSGI